MHITDPDVLAKLKAAPDGVYILVIGESLRGIMRMYMDIKGKRRRFKQRQT